MLGASDVLVKIVAASHCDVLTMLSFRSVIGLAFMAVWLRLGGAPVPANARVRWISIGLGVLLTVLLYCLFEAIDLNDVSTAVLTYFVYPLLTGSRPPRPALNACAGKASPARFSPLAGLRS